MTDGSSPLAPLALSTMWAQRFGSPPDLAAFLAGARDMGFGAVELGHVVTAAALEAADLGDLEVPTVHHPCPCDAVHQGEALVARSRQDREAAADALDRTLDTALEVGAQVIVLHLGRLGSRIGDDARRLAFEIGSRYRAGQAGGPYFRAARDRLLDRVAQEEPEAVADALGALDPVLSRARTAGVSLAVETGHDPDELPSPDGAGRLLDLAPDNLGLWLDSGHVAAQSTLQLHTLTAWASLGPRAFLGAHLHDAVGLRDHLAPGAGTLDFGRVLAVVPPSARLTLEVDWYLRKEEVVAGAKHVLAALAARSGESSAAGPRGALAEG